MSQELAIIESTEHLTEQPQAPLSAMPVMDVKQAIERHKMFVELVSQLLIEGTDYGVIPGTQQKALFKPGAEKLNVFFGLQPNLMMQESREDWDKGFFYYRYRVDLWRGRERVASCEGSANSHEKKYRYAWIDTAKKPNDEEAAKLKSQGIGRWRKGDSNKWVWQERGENPNPADLVNTLQKMAQKRAFVGATLLATNASGFFAHFDAADDDSGQPTADNRQPATAKTASAKPASNSAKPAPEKAVKMITSEEELADEFWKKGRAAGIQTAGLAPIANRAIKGEITWTEAIEQLPEE
jgi:hypothetical protein